MGRNKNVCFGEDSCNLFDKLSSKDVKFYWILLVFIKFRNLVLE